MDKCGWRAHAPKDLEHDFRTSKKRNFQKKVLFFHVGYDPYSMQKTELEYLYPFKN